MSLKTVGDVGKRLCETSLLVLAGMHISWKIPMGWIAGMGIELQTPNQKCLSVVLTNGPSCSDLLQLGSATRRDLETIG